MVRASIDLGSWLRGMFTAVLLLAVSTATAQDLASLIADNVVVEPSGRVSARGNVEIYYNGTRLTARAVTYDRNGDRLTIEGPITVTDPNGTILLADAAELDRDLQNGVLISARMVIDQQLQMAAAEIARVGNRYTRLDRVVASSCEVCAGNPTPIWEIRAAEVIHDAQERQIYFSRAQFRIAGIPVLYLPRLRLPDPTLERATGLLIPSLRTSSSLGTGVKLPYFIALGDHADATITPYVSSKTSTLEFRYRHLIPNGSIHVEGAISDDDIDGRRGYLFANLDYQLPRGFVADAQLEFVSDPGYLFVYDYADRDRLTNAIGVARTRDKDLFRARITEFRTLRENEIPIRDTLPDQYGEIYYQRDIPELAFGGRTVARIDAATLNRPSSSDIVGRDVSRVGVAMDWRRDWTTSQGIIVASELGLRVDAYNIGQDSRFATNQTRIVPRAAVELRWPFARQTSDGGTEILEPVVRLDIADADGNLVPLEDSRIVEFDEANLFAFSRYPGSDGIEDGVRAAFGFAWHRDDPDGWIADLAIGRVARLDGGPLGFEDGSGLAGDQSEWLVAARVGWADRLWLTSRSLFDDNVAFTLSETRLDWQSENFSIGSSVIFAQPEPAEGRNDDLSEWSFDGSVALNETWTAKSDWRYDFQAGRAARTGVGLEYRTECIDVDLSLSRRYATSTSVDPTTDFGFRVSLLGVGNGNDGRSNRRKCRG